jgi:hypothetical protein
MPCLGSIRSCIKLFLLPLLIAAITGCTSSYTLPGKGVNFKEIGITVSPKDAANLAKKSEAKFPASLIIVRLQGSRYENRSVQTYGSGSYCVVMTRDVEKPDQIDTLGHMPLVSGIDTLRKLDLPDSMENEQQLRTAALAENADLLLVYSFDDNFTNEGNDTTADITFGILNTNNFVVTTTASAVLIDARTGLVYGAVEAIAQKKGSANVYGYPAAADAVRGLTEAEAFDDLITKTKRMWNTVVKQYAPPGATMP